MEILFIFIPIGMFAFVIWAVTSIALPMKQKMRKDAYKQALREYDEEKRKKGGN